MPTRAATLAACLLACVLAVPGIASANQELTVSPDFIELDTAAGRTETSTITVTASGDEPITVELVHSDFGFGEDYGVVLIGDDAPNPPSFSTRGWFSLPKERYRIPTGQTRDLPLRVEVPENTPGGTYLGAALLRLVPEDDAGGGQVQAVAQTGPLVFVAVEGGDPPKPVVSTFDVPGRLTSGPLKPKIVVTNEGDEYFTMSGSVELTGPDTKETVEVRRQFVVPDEPRELQASAEDRSEDAGPIRLGSSKLGFGRYTVKLQLRIEPTNRTIVEERTFWVVPTWVWMLVVLAAVVLAASLALLIRWLRLRVVEPDASPQPVATSAPHDQHDDFIDEDSFDEDSDDEYEDADEETGDEYDSEESDDEDLA